MRRLFERVRRLRNISSSLGYDLALGSTHVAYVVQPEARGLCDAIFRALPLEQYIVGLATAVPHGDGVLFGGNLEEIIRVA